MTDSIKLYYYGGAQIFALDAATVNIDSGRSTESMEIPGAPWNTWFDNNNIERKWTVTGTFYMTDNDWNVATYGYHGRPLDFMHQLNCVLNGIDPVTGGLVAASANGFDMEIDQVINGNVKTYRIGQVFNATTVVLLLNRVTFDFTGGEPGTVKYTIVFDEVAEIINMGL